MEYALSFWNSWIFLNHDWLRPLDRLTVLQVLSPVMVAPAVAMALLRLLPERWAFHGMPLRGRTWPALLAALLVLGVWFVRSVTPYSVPDYDHGLRPDFRILHLRKQGLHFQETVVEGFRDGRVWVVRQDRRWFQYRFHSRTGFLVLGEQAPPVHDSVRRFVQSDVLWNLHTGGAKQLWSWNAEGWYVALRETRLLAFTSENGVKPPEEVAALFHDLEALPEMEERPFAARDVCLGFCYDPIAAMGYSVLPQRLRLQP
jgi:hypothetical protein